VITTATLRYATNSDQLVTDLGLAGSVRHGLRHTTLTWMTDSGVPLYVLQANGGVCRGLLRERYATVGLGEEENR
jgi:hypothetical protein